MKSSDTMTLTRRRMLQALAAAGITGPLALELLAQAPTQISADTLKRVSALVGEELSAERLAVVEKALQRNLEHLQVVRELVVDDRIEPAPMFVATRPVTGVTRG